MKHKSRLFMLAVAILSMLIVIGGCSKKDEEKSNDKSDDKSVVVEDDNKDSDDNDASSDEKDNEDIAPDDEKDNEEKIEATDEEEEVIDEIVVGDLPLIEGGIKGVYASMDLLYTGTCINGNVIRQYSDHMNENYNSVTMENEMKPDAILSQSKSIAAGDIVVDYSQRTIELLSWAKDNNMKLRGHVLVWHSQTPQWIFYEDFNTSKPLVDRNTMLDRMDSYIKQNFEQLENLGYLDMFYAYDIVNEAVNDNGTLRDSLWKKTIGDDYIWYAFYYADKYAPEHVQLYYNDFNEQFKTNYLVDLAESLVDEDGRSLIDGLGCQGHLYTKDSIDQYIATLEAFSATGLDVQITELDVSLGTWQSILQPTDENLKEQGQYYYELISRVLEGNKAGTTNVTGITFWGVSDGSSWRKDRNPLLFNLNFKPKYSYFGAVLDKENAGY